MESETTKELNEWSLLGRTLSFPKEVLNYAKYYSEYIELKKGVDAQFCEIYESYGSMEKMISGIEEDCCEIIYCFASVYIDRVIDAGIYDLNEEIFFRDYVSKIKSKMELEEVCDWVVGKYVQIENKKQEMEQYRQLRKASRGRWRGGGFGVGGALAGVAMAGTANAISGLGHSVVNAIGNMESSAAAREQGKKIYKAEETKEKFREALGNDLFTIFRAYILLLHEKFHLCFSERYAADMDKVNTVITNISRRELNTEEVIDIIVEMFETDPYNRKLYQYVLERFGDREMELQRLAEQFAMGSTLDSYKKQILKKIMENSPRKTIADNEKLLQNLTKGIQRNGISEVISEEFCSNVQKQIEDLKREARTFQGVVYETEQEAIEAKQIYELEQEKRNNERQELEKWKAETKFSEKDSLLQLRSKIIERQFIIEEADLCVKKIDEELEKIDRQERTVEGIEYDNHEDALSALKEKEEYEKTRDGLFVELQPFLSEGKYQEAMQYLMQTRVPEVWKWKLKTDLSHAVAQQLTMEITQCCEYKKSKESGGIGTIIAGCIGIIVIGFIISLFIPAAFIIAVVLAVFGIIGNIMETMENRKREPSYKFIQQLIQYGYEIEIK